MGRAATGCGPVARRGYGDGAIYQRCDASTCPPLVDGPPHPTTGKPTRVRPEHRCEGRWVGTLEAGWTAEGRRRRIPVTAKTRGDVVRKLRDRRKELEAFGDSGWDRRTTVKQWVETYLELRSRPPKPLAPKGWKAAAQPLRRWVIPTIGHRAVVDLTPADIRKVDDAQYAATSIRGGRLSSSTVANTRRQLITCLNHAKAEGAAVRDNVFLVAKPGMGRSDRVPMSLDDTLRCLAVAECLPHGLRWALTLLYGTRQGETLGLVVNDPLDGHPCVDFDAGVIRLEWQLQKLDHVDPRRKHLGFKVPYGFDAVHLERRYHLTRPKTAAGFRELPLIGPIAEALRAWLEVRPDNPWGLVFPTAAGRPVDEVADREEWCAIQYTASVEAAAPGAYAAPLDRPAVFHPSGERFYYVHECRNLAATELDEVGASDLVVTSLLGHTSITTSRRYQRASLDAKREAIEAVAKRLGIGSGQL